MLVLPVGLCFVVVTDGELWAAVEAAETQGATLCSPDRVLAKFVGLRLGCFLHFDSLHRTFLGAKAATDALAFVHAEELGLAFVGQ